MNSSLFDPTSNLEFGPASLDVCHLMDYLFHFIYCTLLGIKRIRGEYIHLELHRNSSNEQVGNKFRKRCHMTLLASVLAVSLVCRSPCVCVAHHLFLCVCVRSCLDHGVSSLDGQLRSAPFHYGELQQIPRNGAGLSLLP